MKPAIRWMLIGIVIIVALGVVIINSGNKSTEPQTTTNDLMDTDRATTEDTPFTEAEWDSATTAKPVTLPRMLELGSVGCRPCDMMAPIIEELKKEYYGFLSVEFYDVRKDPAPARQFKIRVIPTQIFLDSEGKEFFRHEGFLPKAEILTVLAQMGVNP